MMMIAADDIDYMATENMHSYVFHTFPLAPNRLHCRLLLSTESVPLLADEDDGTTGGLIRPLYRYRDIVCPVLLTMK